MVIRRKKRTPDFELDLTIRNSSFLGAPNEIIRNAALNKTMAEFVELLEILRVQMSEFVDVRPEANLEDRTTSRLEDEEIMEDWQVPLMEAMVELIAPENLDILEIGFGRGIASDFIQGHYPKKHTIIECNPGVLQTSSEWTSNYKESDIRFVEGKWQDVINDLGIFDAIFFHTYPLNEDEYVDYVAGASTFAEHFFPVASKHLKNGGAFTYLTNEIDSLSRAHQRSLFEHFSSIESKIVPLSVPGDTKDTWWSNQMVIVRAIK